MSGIFKGDSIYKSGGGGGGGGYHDGGQLVDGDFIEVENNTISYYDNVSRDPLNFYFDVSDGEVLNSIIELTTSINSTINVYYVKNGLYYLLGNVGGNTVNAGDDYKINIVGNSFVLEVVTPGQADPEAVEIDGNIYTIKKYGSLLVMTENLKVTSGLDSIIKNGVAYFKPNEKAKNFNSNGWRLPTNTEFGLIKSSGSYSVANMKLSTGWNTPGNNASGFGWTATSIYYSNGDYFYPAIGAGGAYLSIDQYNAVNIWYLNDFVNNIVFDAIDPSNYYTIRLVKQI